MSDSVHVGRERPRLLGTDTLWAALDELRPDGRLDVELDLSGLEFVRADRDLRAAGGTLALTGVRPSHRRLLALTALDQVRTVR